MSLDNELQLCQPFTVFIPAEKTEAFRSPGRVMALPEAFVPAAVGISRHEAAHFNQECSHSIVGAIRSLRGGVQRSVVFQNANARRDELMPVVAAVVVALGCESLGGPRTCFRRLPFQLGSTESLLRLFHGKAGLSPENLLSS